MTSMAALWLAILVSSVLVFVASSVIHMVSGWHTSDYPPFPRESDVLDALRPIALPPGDYLMPRPASMAEMKSPEFVARISRGPVVLMTVFPNGPAQMGGTMVRWFLYLIVVSAIAAFVAATALPPAAPAGQIWRLVFTTAFAGYALGLWQLSIWYRRAWSITIKATVDAAIYAAITAAVFAWLWPQ
jgi:hypothetical protein